MVRMAAIVTAGILITEMSLLGWSVTRETADRTIGAAAAIGVGTAASKSLSRAQPG